QEHVRSCVALNQRAAYQRSLVQCERSCQLLARQLEQCRSLGLERIREADMRQRDRSVGRTLLSGVARHFDEVGAQTRVSTDQNIQRTLQPGDVELSFET